MNENITLWLSIFAFALSLYNFLENFINSIKKVSINIYEINEFKFNENYFVYQALITISNKSNLPIAITHLVANEIPCKIEPNFVSETTHKQGKEIIFKEVIKTMPFPVNLSPLMSANGYIEFTCNTPINKNNIRFDIYTNRGKLSSVTPMYINCQ